MRTSNSSAFFNQDHAEAFAAGRALYQRGGEDAAICGATTRKGTICKDVPIKGSKRCIRHCGPKAANAHRERQRGAFLSGKISAAEWQKAEAKRAMNRLRDRWKKDPWLTGATIDLGAHEDTFRQACGAFRVQLGELPPAVRDWLRWKFRRHRIDRADEHKWSDVVQVQLVERLQKIGPRTRTAETRQWNKDGRDNRVFLDVACSGLFKVQHTSDTPKSDTSKRTLPDQPKQPPKFRPRRQFGRGRPRKEMMLEEDDLAELGRLNAEYRVVLTPLYQKCQGERDRMNVLYALRAYVRDPEDRGARDRWFGTVRTLSAA